MYEKESRPKTIGCLDLFIAYQIENKELTNAAQISGYIILIENLRKRIIITAFVNIVLMNAFALLDLCINYLKIISYNDPIRWFMIFSAIFPLILIFSNYNKLVSYYILLIESGFMLYLKPLFLLGLTCIPIINILWLAVIFHVSRRMKSEMAFLERKFEEVEKYFKYHH